jgi:putative NIF3 family GTP cyclohydrolase 1 type 2
MSNKVADIIRIIEKWIPEKFAVKEDKIGLITGSYQKEVKKIMVTLDVNHEVVKEAAANKVDMIFAHHNPFILSHQHLFPTLLRAVFWQSC